MPAVDPIIGYGGAIAKVLLSRNSRPGPPKWQILEGQSNEATPETAVVHDRMIGRR